MSGERKPAAARIVTTALGEYVIFLTPAGARALLADPRRVLAQLSDVLNAEPPAPPFSAQLVCPECGRPFARLDNLQRHIRTRHPYYNPDRARTCGDVASVENSGEAVPYTRRVPCPVCGLPVARYMLELHVERVHSEPVQPKAAAVRRRARPAASVRPRPVTEADDDESIHFEKVERDTLEHDTCPMRCSLPRPHKIAAGLTVCDECFAIECSDRPLPVSPVLRLSTDG